MEVMNMVVTAAMVKELRTSTSAGMMDCKKALTEANGDMEKAVEVLREKGLAKAAKKAGRIAAEGLVATFVEGNSASIVEVNSESDFVTKNDIFKNYVAEVAQQAMTSTASDIDAFLAEESNVVAGQTMNEVLTAKISVIGENLKIRRFAKVTAEAGTVVSYIHAGGKIGVLLEIETDVVNDAVKECGRNLAMQVAALNPTHLDRSEVSEEWLAKETAILKEVAKNESPEKPDNIIDKMIIGRVNKMLKEICLVDQPYVKDGDFTVSKYVAQVAKEQGAKMSVKAFTRFETGEGIAKKEENFAEEVARQMQV